MRLIQFLSYLFIISVNASSGAKILTVFSTPSKSHSILGLKLAEGLIKKGHEVTLASSFPVTPMKNLTHIHLKLIFEFQEKGLKRYDKLSNTFIIFQRIIEITKKVNELFWQDPNVQKLLKEKPTYDLLIVMTFFNDAILGIGHHLGVPTVIFSNVGTFSIWNNYVANPTMPYSQDPILSIPADNFLGRLATVTGNFLMAVLSRYQIEPVNQALLDKYLPDAPPLMVLQKNVSIVLANSHVSIEPARPYVPNMIQIGGFHVQEVQPLPTDIRNFLDDAKQGAILFTLGSLLKFEMIAKEKRGAVLKVLGEMAPVKVILKAEMEQTSAPENVMVKPWLPQADILAHPNVKLFISHGGLGGNTESVYHGVPILGIPFYGDQVKNLNEAKSAGYAEVIGPQDITEDRFSTILKNMMSNTKYAKSVARRSALMKEQSVKPMDTVNFWINHIIKYGGGSHLKNAGADLEWYELYMMDIYIFYTIFFCLLFIIMVRAIRLVYTSTFRNPIKIKKC